MEPEIKQETAVPNPDVVQVDVGNPESGTMTAYSSDTTSGAAQAKEQWQKLGEQTSKFLSELPAYVSEFFSEYKRPLVTIGLILGTILVAKIALAVLGAVNEVPLLAPTFELIGIGYSAWFIYRYLLKASTRSELADDFESLKDQVLGGRDKFLDRFAAKNEDTTLS